MAFTKEKFLSLKPETQAKKCADLIRKVLLFFPQDWKTLLNEYNDMCTWLEKPNYCTDIKILKQDALLERYTFWRKQSGLGLEDDVFTAFTMYDREEPLSHTVQAEVLLHNLRSGHNVGSIIRTVDCFGWSKVHVSGYTPRGNSRAVLSSSMGAETWIPTQEWNSPQECMETLKAQGYQTVALETDESAVALDQFEWPKKVLLLVGNEELGIPGDLIEACDHFINIPMYGRKGSMNVSNAFSIAAFSARRFISP